MTLNGPWYNFVPITLCKRLKAQVERIETKTIKVDF